MKRTLLAWSACCLLACGCSKPTAEAPLTPTATPSEAVKSEQQLEEQAAEKRKMEEAAVDAQALPAVPGVTHSIPSASPSPSP